MERCGANTKRGEGGPAPRGGAGRRAVRAAARGGATRGFAGGGLPGGRAREWLGEVVADLEKNAVVHGITRSVQLPDGTRTVEARAAVNPWVRLYLEERDRLVRVAEVAIDTGVAERQVRLAEAQAQQLAAVIRAILTDLGTTRRTSRFERWCGSGWWRASARDEPAYFLDQAGGHG